MENKILETMFEFCDMDLMQCQEYFKQGVRIGVQFLNELKEVCQ